jgi:amino acid transporter
LGQRSPIFVREATGLVRQIGFWGTLGYTGAYMTYIATYGITPPTVAGLVPGADLLVGFVVAWAVQLITTIGYIFLAVSMPRSGGDYVWVSRAVNPILGFVSGWGWWLSAIFFAGSSPFFVMTLGIIPGLSFIGGAASNASLTNLATFLAIPNVTLISGISIAIIFTLLNIVSLKWVVRVASAFALFSFLGFLVVAGVLTGGSLGTVSSAFASYTGQSTASVVAAAAKAGYSPTPFSSTIASIPIWEVFALAGSQYMVYLGGEIKQVKKSMTYALIVNMGITFFVYVFGLLLLNGVVTKEFYGALSYLWISANPSYPIPGGYAPTPQFFAFLVNPNLSVTAFISLATIASFMSTYLIYMPWISRVIFAMSFDRMLPSRLADVNPRFGTPVKALVVAGVAAILCVYFWFAGFASALINGGIILSFIYLIAGIAAIVFPYRMKSTFEASAVNYRLGGIPVISIVGVAMVGLWAWILEAALTSPALGVLGAPVYTLTVVLFGSGLVAYFIIKGYWKSKGVDISLAFKEIPPE